MTLFDCQAICNNQYFSDDDLEKTVISDSDEKTEDNESSSNSGDTKLKIDTESEDENEECNVKTQDCPNNEDEKDRMNPEVVPASGTEETVVTVASDEKDRMTPEVVPASGTGENVVAVASDEEDQTGSPIKYVNYRNLYLSYLKLSENLFEPEDENEEFDVETPNSTDNEEENKDNPPAGLYSHISTPKKN